MGYSPGHLIESAALHLLALLREHSCLQYSRFFFDGSNEMHEALMRAIGLEDDWYSAEALIDLAVVQLREQGVVVSELLEGELADGEEDFLIKWSKDGERMDHSELTFRDME